MITAVCAVLAGPILAGCRGADGQACLAQVGPLEARVREAVEGASACTADVDCVLVEPDLPCLDACAVAVSDPAPVEAALAEVGPDCPACEVSSLCFVTEPYCDQGACDTCRDPGRVGDGVTPGDDCWAPPRSRCSDVDVDRPPLRACPPEGQEGPCCAFDRGCLPCGWVDCSATPTPGPCLEAGSGSDAACPTVPVGTTCFDPERFG